jgi:hypothetical protein
VNDTVCLSSTYLGPVSYYCKLYAYRHIFIDAYDRYQKQTYRNRCLIAAADGVMPLSIPVVRRSSSHEVMRDIRISDHGNWHHLHWQALVSAYAKSPYFEFYEDDFRPFYEKHYDFLLDFNEALREKVCTLLDLQPHIELTTGVTPESTCCAKRDAETNALTFSPKPYYQVFSQRIGFQPDLSIVDLLFNMGPESLIILRDSPKRDV